MPQNASLIIALYGEQKLKAARVYRGGETLECTYAADFAEAMNQADYVKAFLWELNGIKLLAGSKGGYLADLPEDTVDKKTAVLYFSATGTTKRLAETIAAVVDGELIEIVPEEPYTSEDLNYNDLSSRATREQRDPAARPAILGSIAQFDRYDTIYLGYPIWWGTMPKIINTLLESYDFSGKKIMPFCTSGSSGIASSVSAIQTACPAADVADGFRGTGSTTEAEIQTWREENSRLHLQIGEHILTATLVKNTSTAALKELLASGPLTIDMSDYGNFEKVGPLGTSLPQNDEQITTQAGDLILYLGNSFVIYYDTNSWNFTKLGAINHITQAELKNILGSGDVTVTLFME